MSGYGIDGEITTMIDEMDWYIVPIFNVDGYAYTWTDVSVCVGGGACFSKGCDAYSPPPSTHVIWAIFRMRFR